MKIAFRFSGTGMVDKFMVVKVHLDVYRMVCTQVHSDCRGRVHESSLIHRTRVFRLVLDELQERSNLLDDRGI